MRDYFACSHLISKRPPPPNLSFVPIEASSSLSGACAAKVAACNAPRETAGPRLAARTPRAEAGRGSRVGVRGFGRCWTRRRGSTWRSTPRRGSRRCRSSNTWVMACVMVGLAVGCCSGCDSSCEHIHCAFKCRRAMQVERTARIQSRVNGWLRSCGFSRLPIRKSASVRRVHTLCCMETEFRAKCDYRNDPDRDLIRAFDT
jgi:hypothetical protein